jgi:hypothetical protein
LIASVGLNVLLARKVRNLTAVVEAKLKYPVLMPGSQAPPLAAQNMEGKLVSFDYKANQFTVLYVFSLTVTGVLRTSTTSPFSQKEPVTGTDLLEFH